jgi:outer membrane protein assembly factor BamB
MVAVSPGEGEGSVALTPTAEPVELSAEAKAAWGMTAPLVNLEGIAAEAAPTTAGSPKLVPAPPYAADIITDRPGLEWPDTVMEDNERGWCVLYGMEGGQRKELWRSEQFRVYQGPHPIVADANGDGQLDVIACPHYQIIAMDGRTGKTIEQLQWHNGRNYGHFIAKDIDGDHVPEFLVLADFYTHIDLIDNDGSNLKLLWRKEIELQIEAKQKILRPRWDSLQDLDGDGRFEVITNLYNDTGDKQWHLMVWDALTGNTVLDLPGTFLSGLEEVDGDGRVELFCCRTSALFEPTAAPLMILNLVNGQATERWTGPAGAWVPSARRYPLWINSLVAHAEDNIATVDLPGGRKGFCMAAPEAGEVGSTLKCLTLGTDGAVREAWSASAPPGVRTPRVLGQQGNEALVGIAPPGPDGRVQTKECRAEPVAWTRTLPERARWGNLLAADLDGDGTVTVISTAANREVVALKGTDQSVRWRHRGAGTLAAADFDGDGAKEVAMLGWEPSGEGNVTVIDGSGEVLWQTPIAGFPGPLEPWNSSTLTTLAAGKLSGAAHDDLIVFARRSTMHSDEGYALSGPDGRLLWHCPAVSDGERNWGFGGTPVALFDTDGDGADDIISLYPVNLTVVSGRDGKQLVGRSAAGDSIFPGIWAAYSEPTLFDYTGDGVPELTWNGQYCLGITNLTGDTLWGKTPPATGFPADADGDGRCEIASPVGKTMRWLDPANGEARWTLDLPANAGPFAIADVDGDGAEEAVVACGKLLVAVSAKDGQPAIRWQLEAPSAVEEFILADTDGDGALEAVLSCADGLLRGVDGS